MRHALNSAPLNGFATLLGSGQASMALAAGGNGKLAITGSGVSTSARTTLNSARATLRLKAIGTVASRLSASGNGIVATSARGQSIAATLQVQGNAFVITPKRGSGQTRTRLTLTGNPKVHTPRFGAGKVHSTMDLRGKAKLIMAGKGSPAQARLQLSGAGRTGCVRHGSGKVVSSLLVFGAGRILPVVRGSGVCRLSLRLVHVHSWPPVDATAKPNASRTLSLPSESRMLVANAGNTMLGTLPKATGDQLDYTIDCSKWLPAGDTIQSAQATITSDDGQLLLRSVAQAAKTVTVWMAGGKRGQTYTVEVNISTTAGRQKTEAFGIRIR